MVRKISYLICQHADHDPESQGVGKDCIVGSVKILDRVLHLLSHGLVVHHHGVGACRLDGLPQALFDFGSGISFVHANLWKCFLSVNM